MYSPVRKFLYFTAVLTAFGLPLLAQNPASEEEEVFELSPFLVETDQTSYVPKTSVVASGFAIENVKNPINISSLTGSFIEDQVFDDLGDAVAYTAGASKAANSNGSLHGTRILVRGFNTTWFNRNGLRRYVINGTDNLDRLEIVKGPAAVFFGEAAPGGVLNYVTKRPSQTPANSLQVQYGSYDYMRVEAESQGPLLGSDIFSYRINASYLDREDWRDFEWQERTFVYAGLLIQPVKNMRIYLEYEFIDDRNNDALSLPQGDPFWLEAYYALGDDGNPVVDYYLANPSTIGRDAGSDRSAVIDRLQSLWRRGSGGTNSRFAGDIATALGVDESEVLSEHRLVPDATPYGYRWNSNGENAFVEHDLDNITVEATWSPFDWLSLRAYGVRDDALRRAYLHNNEIISVLEPEGPGFNGQFPSIGGLGNESESYGISGVIQFETGSNFEHSFILGWDEFDDTYINPEVVDNATNEATIGWNYFTDGYPESNFNDSSIEFPIPDHYRYRESMYGNYILRLWDSKVVTMVGVRREKGHIQSHDTGTFAWKVDEETPSAGIVVELFEGVNFFTSYSESFTPGSAPASVQIDTGNLIDLNDDGSTTDERDDLLEAVGIARFPGAQEGEGYDIGFKTNWRNDTITGTVSYYSVSQLNNASVRDDEGTVNDPLNDPFKAADPNWTVDSLPVVRNTLFGESRVEGIELDLMVQPSANWSTLITYNRFLKSEQFRLSGDPLQRTYSPDHQFSIWSRYDFRDGFLEGFSVAGGMSYSSKYYTKFPRGRDNVFEDGYTTFDALLRYEKEYSNGTLQLSLNVRNITDERYIDSGVGHPGSNRRFMITTKWIF